MRSSIAFVFCIFVTVFNFHKCNANSLPKLVLTALPDLNITELTKLVFEMQQQFDSDKNFLKDSIAQLQVEDSELRNTITQLKKSESKLNKTVEKLQNEEERLKEKMKELESGGQKVPIDTVYIQYPKEVKPSQLWNCSQGGRWIDISDTYANLFFRVDGDQSTFGRVQDESSPRIDRVKYDHCNRKDSDCKHEKKEIELGAGWSEGILTSYHQLTAYNPVHAYHHYFHTTEEEVRPRNMAIRVWKCINDQ